MARSACERIVLVFLLVRLSARSRGSVGERPLHTRKVAGSIPAGTTTIAAGKWKCLGLLRNSKAPAQLR